MASKRNPLLTSSYGTGELIVDALERGARKVIIGLGGSATIDAGAGLLQALGIRFRNKQGRIIRKSASGGMLHSIEDIDTSKIHKMIKDTEFCVAVDVTNSLCGSKGAANIFGKQKGATPEGIKTLDKNLAHFASIVHRVLNIDVTRIKGGGAAGGMGAGLYAFLGARPVSGIELILEATQLKTHLKQADLLITGEGRIDMQSAYGKNCFWRIKTCHFNECSHDCHWW